MSLRPTWLLGVIVCLLAAAGQGAAGSDNPAANVYEDWLWSALAARVNPAGGDAAAQAQDAATQTRHWWTFNGEPAAATDTITFRSERKGAFVFAEFDLGVQWPQFKHARRKVIYYTADRPYAIVLDRLQGDSVGFWEWRLPLPPQVAPVNWNIQFTDSDRRADLLAGLDSEFNGKTEWNLPVRGSAAPTAGNQMLLARLLRSHDERLDEAPPMSPMNVRRDARGAWLSSTVRSASPDFAVLLMPYRAVVDELPRAVLGPNVIRLEWHDRTHVITLFPRGDGDLNLTIKARSEDAIDRLGFGMPYQEEQRPSGKLIASYEFESMSNGRITDAVHGLDGQVENGRLVDGLAGKSIYLGEPQTRTDPVNQNVKATTSGITLPDAIYDQLQAGHLTISMWFKGPIGQDGSSWFWPITNALRSGNWISLGGFRVFHTHWSYQVLTAGFESNRRRIESGTLLPGKWNHLVVTVQSLERFKWRYEVYVNGAITSSHVLTPEKELRHSKPWQEIRRPFRICSNEWGAVDNLKIYDYPLDEDQVQALYREPLKQQIVHYDCQALTGDGRLEAEPRGDYPEDRVVENRWAADRNFTAAIQGGELVEGVEGKAVQLSAGVMEIPSKVLADRFHDAFTFAFYFKYGGHGANLITNRALRFAVNWNMFNGAIAGDWQNKSLIDKEHKLKPDVWQHLALTYDGRVAIVYVDGRELYRRPAVAEGLEFSDPIQLGQNAQVAFDEIRIFNHAVTPQQVRQLARGVARP